MKTDVRAKISTFLTSEEGKVAVKAPLKLGTAVGSLLLAHAIVSPTDAMACWGQTDCADHEKCVGVTEVCWDDLGTETCIDVQGTCFDR